MQVVQASGDGRQATGDVGEGTGYEVRGPGKNIVMRFCSSTFLQVLTHSGWLIAES